MKRVVKSKAFHAVSGGPAALRHILEEGEIRPAWERTNPDVAAGLCAGWVEEAQKPGSGAIPAAIDALKDLIEERLDEIASVAPYSDVSKFECEDILAGDFDNVFLSVDEWHEALSQEDIEAVSGFVFDAEGLIKKGGVLRRRDLIDEYWQTLTGFLSRPGGRKTADALKNQFGRLRRKYELTGSNALSALRREGGEAFVEILFPDRLPVDWAIEVWENGSRVG